MQGAHAAAQEATARISGCDGSCVQSYGSLLLTTDGGRSRGRKCVELYDSRTPPGSSPADGEAKRDGKRERGSDDYLLSRW